MNFPHKDQLPWQTLIPKNRNKTLHLPRDEHCEPDTDTKHKEPLSPLKPQKATNMEVQAV